jgi:tetratricopeptide (TPR) repeat protein
MLKVSSAIYITALMLVLLSPAAFCLPPSSDFGAKFAARKRIIWPGKPSAEAISAADQSIKTKPSWEAFYRRAILRYERHQFAAAAQDCEQSLKLQKSQAAYYVLTACSLMQGPGSWTKALQTAASMAEANPEATYPHEYGAYIAFLRGDFASSLDHLAAYNAKVVLTSHSRYQPPVPGPIGRLSAEDLHRIIAMLGQKSDKQKPNKKLLLALVEYFRNDYVGSAATSNELRQTGAGRKQGHSSEGDLALALSICNDQMLARTEGIEEKALQLVQHSSECKPSLTLLDTTYFVLNQRDKSLAFINHLVEQSSVRAGHSETSAKLIDLLYFRASLHEEMNDIRSAWQDCQRILKLQPEQRKARLDVCRYKLALGESEELLPDLNNYVATYPGDAAANFLRAQLFVLDKKWQPAVRDLSVALDGGYYLLKSLQARAACYRAMHQNRLAANDIELVNTFKLDNSIVLELSTTADH